jgi:L-asparaginase
MKMLFIQAGGTIDKDYPKLTNGYGFEITEPASQRILKRINPSFEYKVIEVLKKDSLDITEAERDLIVAACQRSDYERIVITHGTDTMLKSAAKLAVINDKTIVLTGAAKPEHFKESDADFNLGTAIGAIQSLPHGVYIAMHGRVLPYDKSIRESVTGQFVEKR